MTAFALKFRVFVLTLAAMAMLLGAVTFLNMPRRESPEMTTRVALVIGQWPGASAQKVDELIVDVLEGAIQRVDEVDEIRSTSQVGFAVIEVELDKTVTADVIDQVWDDLRTEIRAVERDLPTGALSPFVNSNFGDVSSLCLVMHQRPSPASQPGESLRPYTEREMDVFAELVEEELEAIEAVSSVTIYGLSDERIYLEVGSADWSKLGLGPEEFQAALARRNIVVASGEVESPRGKFLLRSSGELETTEEFGSVVVGTNEGGLPVLMRDLPVSVRRGLDDPISQRVRFLEGDHRSDRSVLIGIEMKAGANVVEMGEAVRSRLAAIQERSLPPDIDFAAVNDLPRQVGGLVWDFVNNLWQAIVVVLLVAFAMMGWRPAVVMATAVPLSMVASLAAVRIFGVELEQFSIASMIIALGMIVDNAIVVSDQTSAILESGETRLRSAIRGASELAVPILTSTLTTVAAFLPLLLIPGNTGEYIRSLPIVVSVTLLASYFVAMAVTPIMCFAMLRPKSKVAATEGRWMRMYGNLVAACLRAKGKAIAVAGVAVLGALLLVPIIGNQFFPGGERDQFFVHFRMPHGSTLQQTAEIVEEFEELLLATATTDVAGEAVNRLNNAYTFVGSGGPRLMMTMDPEDPSPRYAFMVVNTVSADYSLDWVSELRVLAARIPGVNIDVRNFVLGPPLDLPVEYRISGPDAEVLRELGEEMVSSMREVEGVLDPYHDWGNSTYQVEVDIDDQRVQLAGLDNRSVAQSLNAMIAGYPLTQYREGDYSVPVLLRLRPRDRDDLRDLEQMYVGGSSGKVPLASVADVTASWQPARIVRCNRSRAIKVGTQVEDGFLATAVSTAARPGMERILAKLPPGYRLEELGEQKESAESQGDMGQALIISLGLILLVLIAQYNSLAKPFVVLAAVPLALIGALVGLLVTGWPLGFMPMLGIVSLAGVVINNAIILIDCIQGEVAQGVDLHDAVVKSGKVRMRPILLTTLTTIGGMLPLALFGGSMWAGMSWAMIFGLGVSTGLTLVVVPTIYVAFVEWFGVQVVQEGVR